MRSVQYSGSSETIASAMSIHERRNVLAGRASGGVIRLLLISVSPIVMRDKSYGRMFPAATLDDGTDLIALVWNRIGRRVARILRPQRIFASEELGVSISEADIASGIFVAFGHV
jgi:hypothetical protein